MTSGSVPRAGSAGGGARAGRSPRARHGRPPREAPGPPGPPRAPRPRRAPAASEPRPLPALERGAAVAALVTAWAVVFWPQIGRGAAFVRGDVIAYRAFGQFSLARWQELGERTYWNPYVMLGAPSVASLADPRPQWLPGPLLSGWDALGAGPWSPHLPGLVVLLAGMLAMAALARALWGCGAGAMVVAALAWGLSPSLVAPVAHGRDGVVLPFALLPAALLAIERALGAAGAARARAWALAAAAAIGLVGLTGTPRTWLPVAAAAAAWAVARGWRQPARLAWIAGAAGLGAALSAAVWLPAWRYAAWAHRPVGEAAVDAARGMSLALRDLLALAWPRAVGYGGNDHWGGAAGIDHAHTLGGVAAALASWTIVAGARGPGRGTVRALAAAGAAACALALGPRLPGIGAALVQIPPFAAVRAPQVWAILAILAGALLAAHGLERAVAIARGGAGARLGAAAAALLILAAVVVGAASPLGAAWSARADATRPVAGAGSAGPAGRRATSPYAPAARRAIADLAARLALGGAALGAAALAGPAGALPAGALVAALAGGDVGWTVRGEVSRASGERSELAPPPIPRLAVIALPDRLHRAYPLDPVAMLNNYWIDWRTASVGGLLPDPPRPWAEAAEAGLFRRDGFVRSCAVRYVAGAEARLDDTARFEPTADPRVRAIRGALPRAYAVPRVVALDGDTAVARALFDGRYRPEAAAFTTDAGAAGDYPGAAGAALRWTRDDPDAIALSIDAPSAAFVVVADAWFPGWRATLDGAAVPLHRVNHLMRGVAVPAGTHALAMTYRPEGWSAGRATSLGAWLAWLAAAAWAVVAARRPRAARADR